MDIMNVFQNFAFPVACTIFLAWLSWNQQQTINKFSNTLEKINTNLDSMNKRMEKLEEKVGD